MSVAVRTSATEHKPQNSDGLDDAKTSVRTSMQESDLPGVSSITIAAFLHVVRMASSVLYGNVRTLNVGLGSVLEIIGSLV